MDRYREQLGGYQRQGWDVDKMDEGDQKIQSSSCEISSADVTHHGDYNNTVLYI